MSDGMPGDLPPAVQAAVEKAFDVMPSSTEIGGHDPSRPAMVVAQNEDGVTWCVIRDYGHRQEGLRDGTGCFFVFQTKDDKGEWSNSAVLNGGLIDRTADKLQGDLDLLIPIDGKPAGFAIVGNMGHVGGPDAGLVPINDAQMNLGAPGQRIRKLYVTELAMMTVGKQLKLNGQAGWYDCIGVRTQAGMRWMPVFEQLNEEKPSA